MRELWTILGARRLTPILYLSFLREERRDVSPDNWGELNAENREIWEINAAFWDQRMADGNEFQRFLVGPATERLLELRPGESVLEVACGNGVMARRLADLGAKVVACDFVPSLIELARQRSQERGDEIDYRVIDATAPEQLLSLGQNRFDAVVCNMAIMDMAEIKPLFGAVPKLLGPSGRFVFSLCHPCFNNSACIRTAEETDRGGELRVVHSVRITEYQSLGLEMGIAMKGQSRPQYYFNRTLSALFAACFSGGMVVDGLEEPGFGEQEGERSTSWRQFVEIPPVLAVRARVWR